MVLWTLLRRRGLDGQLRVGMKVDNSDDLSFDAWVEYRSHVLNDTPDVAERYISFNSALEPPPS